MGVPSHLQRLDNANQYFLEKPRFSGGIIIILAPANRKFNILFLSRPKNFQKAATIFPVLHYDR